MSCLTSAADFAYEKARELEEKAKQYAILRSEDARQACKLLRLIAERIRESMVP